MISGFSEMALSIAMVRKGIHMAKKIFLLIFPIIMLTSCSYGKDLLAEIEKNPNVLCIKERTSCKDFEQDCTLTIEMKDHSELTLYWNHFDFWGIIRFNAIISIDGYSYYMGVYEKESKTIGVTGLLCSIYPVKYKNLEKFIKKRSTLAFLTSYEEIKKLLKDIPVLPHDEMIKLSNFESSGYPAENWLNNNLNHLYIEERGKYSDFFFKVPTPDYLR